MQKVASACPLDCPDACSLEVGVEGGRVASIGGSRVNSVTNGYICAKVRRFPEHMYGPDRILSPGIRVGFKGEGRFREASWDEALDLVSSRFVEAAREFGGEAILPYSYGGSNGLLTQDTTDARLFRRLGSSRLARTVCAAPSSAAATGLYGKMAGIAYEDYPRAKLIVLWGVNPSASGIHLVPYVFEAQKKGARLVVIDPRSTPLSERADLHLPVRPGADLPVALAVVRWLFSTGRADEKFLRKHTTGSDRLRAAAQPWTFDRAAEAAGIPAADLEMFAEMYSDSSPAAIRCGWGLERNRNGGSAVAAVLSLPAVAGKFGVRGGGYTMSNSGAWKLDPLAAAREPEPPTRIVNMNRLGEALLDFDSPPVQCLFVYNSNALATTPRQEKVREGLRREDLFTVVFDSVLTDTARYADVVLPATTFLEHHEMSRGYGVYRLFDSPPVALPAGEARSNPEVFADLCRRTGVARPGDPETAAQLGAAILESHPRGRDFLESIARDGVASPVFGTAPVQWVDVLPNTPDAKAHLFPDDLDRQAPLGLYAFQQDPGSGAFPLALISPASDKTISSTLGELDAFPAALEIHPEDAAARGLTGETAVRVYNDLGEVRCLLRITPGIRPGVVQLPKGLWARHTLNGATANALAPDTLADLGGGACFNDARVEVEAVRSS
ncbi:MAG: molybdopterin-containing oxidoreductase family protein [Thermoanaerobaculia bacterium]